MLCWTKQYDIFSFLDNCAHANTPPHRFECLVGAGAIGQVDPEDISLLDGFIRGGEWYFGHLCFEALHKPSARDRSGFPPVFFFQPEIVLALAGNTLTIRANDPDGVFEQVQAQPITEAIPSPVNVYARLTKAEYLDRIHRLLQHLQRGDCFEINFCQEFYADEAVIHPHDLFRELTRISPNPFSALYRINDSYLICASPERFLLKEGNKIRSQPMKGTIARSADQVIDSQLKEQLSQSAKDRSENVMIVDLVRNDLSRIAEKGSVKVEELFGVYSYPNVHQMISTVSATLDTKHALSGIMDACFPMGSMTGAPKHRVLQIIDELEPGSRGIFSGTIGYIDPEGDFDFNVVIRSIMYDQKSRQLSYQVGSGITIYSEPELEWEECQLKAAGIKKVLAGSQHDKM